MSCKAATPAMKLPGLAGRAGSCHPNSSAPATQPAGLVQAVVAARRLQVPFPDMTSAASPARRSSAACGVPRHACACASTQPQQGVDIRRHPAAHTGLSWETRSACVPLKRRLSSSADPSSLPGPAAAGRSVSWWSSQGRCTARCPYALSPPSTRRVQGDGPGQPAEQRGAVAVAATAAPPRPVLGAARRRSAGEEALLCTCRRRWQHMLLNMPTTPLAAAAPVPRV